MQNILKLVALATSAAALAVPQSEPLEKRAGVAFTDTFDDLPANRPVGTYHGITYGGEVVLRPVKGAASVDAHSGAQLAGASIPSDAFQLGQLTLNTYATLVPAAGVTSFDLESFWYGLGTETGTTAGIAQGGTIVVVAYDVTGRQIPTTSFSYAPQKALDAPLVFGQLPDTYKNLKNASITLSTSEPVTQGTYIALDDVKHVNHV